MDNGVILEQIRSLHADVADIKGALSRLAEAITKLALIEERQTRSGESIDRAFAAIDKLSGRIHVIEQSLPALTSQATHAGLWIDRALWAVSSGALVYLAKAAGFLG